MRGTRHLQTPAALAVFLSLFVGPVLAQGTEAGIEAASTSEPSLLAAPSQTSDAAARAALASAASRPARSDGTDILSCPFETLRAAYLSLYEETDALNVAALESEVFKVCIERQKQVKQLLDNEARLRTQLGDLGDGARRSASNAVAAISHAPTTFEAEIAEEEQDAPETPTTITLAPDPPADFREAKSAELAQSALPTCSDRYTSGPVFGSVTLDGGLHAFVFDATRGTRLTVKSGDALPGGLIIARISTENGVIVSEQGVERPLARTLTAPAFDDGGGLLFKTVSLADVYKLDSAASDTRDGSQDSTRNNEWEGLE